MKKKQKETLRKTKAMQLDRVQLGEKMHVRKEA